ncbi:GNAT family N-acetyltransferase [Spirosoma pollinicola]|uniref:N-acetyltransferase n=1 Tax=Spirosoma pollinicola TaxID=2057025 RepID=A0A2K8ZAY1_9BACT|nr:GNAT family protein [Spirosoma pollinicola]AUD07051.1 N-acetyltransferase [Spirosoma pollinicola]
MFKTLYSDSITLHLITEDNLSQVYDLFQGFSDSKPMQQELFQNYLPKYEKGLQVNYGFYSLLGDRLAGMSLLSIDSWPERSGSTGADVFEHMRGRGVTPRSKPHLFYLAFELLNLNRVATGCLISNYSSKRSIEKTIGFQFEGISRESGINEQGEFEDEYIYSILHRDWLNLYDKSQVQVIT